MISKRAGTVCVVTEGTADRKFPCSIYGVFSDEATARAEYFAPGMLTSGAMSVQFVTLPLWGTMMSEYLTAEIEKWLSIVEGMEAERDVALAEVDRLNELFNTMTRNVGTGFANLYRVAYDAGYEEGLRVNY